MNDTDLLREQVRQLIKPTVTRILPPDMWIERQFRGLALKGIAVHNTKKIYDFVLCWREMLLTHVSKIDIMPDVTDKQKEERMLANVRGLRALKGTWRNK